MPNNICVDLHLKYYVLNINKSYHSQCATWNKYENQSSNRHKQRKNEIKN